MNSTIKLDIVIIGLSYLNTYFPVKGIFLDNMTGIIIRTLIFMIFLLLIDENKFPQILKQIYVTG